MNNFALRKSFTVHGYPNIKRVSKRDYKFCVLMHLSVTNTSVAMGFFEERDAAVKELDYLTATNLRNKNASFTLEPVVSL